MSTEGSSARHDPITVGEGDLGCVLNRTSRLLRQRLQDQLREQAGPSDLEYIVLQTVIGHWERFGVPVSADLIAQTTTLPAEEVASAVSRLLADGWLINRAGGDHEMLEPSAQALRRDSAVRDTTRWLFETALNGFSHEEIDELMAMLNRVYRNLREL